LDVFGDHAVSCKKSGFANGRRPADISLSEWDGRRDQAVDLTIVHPNPVAGRHLRGSAGSFLKDKREQEWRESADSCGRMGVASKGQGRSRRRRCSPVAPPRSFPAPAQGRFVP